MGKTTCLICDGEASMGYYGKEASAEEIRDVLDKWKVCARHKRELETAETQAQKTEIGRAVA